MLLFSRGTVLMPIGNVRDRKKRGASSMATHHTHTHTCCGDQEVTSNGMDFVPPGLCTWRKHGSLRFQCLPVIYLLKATAGGSHSQSRQTVFPPICPSTSPAFILSICRLNSPNRFCLITLCSETRVGCCELGGADDGARVCVCVRARVHPSHSGFHDENLSINRRRGFVAT